MSSEQKKSSLGVIFFTVFMYLVGFGVIIPLLPSLSTELGASPLQVGILMATYSFMQFLFSPFWGRLSDKYGRRPILLFCLAGEVGAYVLFALARSVEGLIFARALSGVLGASLSTASAAISDVTPPQERSKGMALIGAAFGLGFIFGPALGGGLAVLGESLSAEPLAGSTFTLFGVAALCALNFVFAFFFLKETKNPGFQPQPQGRFEVLFSEIRRPVVGPLIAVFFLCSFAMAAMESTLALLTFERFQWGIKEVSIGFTFIGVMSTLNQGFLVRRLLPLWGEKTILRVGLALTAVSLGAVGFVHDVWILGLVMTFFSLGYGFLNPSILGSISLLSPPESQGQTLGTTQGTASLGRIFGPLAGGALFGAVGSWAPYVLASIVLAACLGIVILLGSRIPSKAQKGSEEIDPTQIIGRFQLENLLENRVPFVLLSLGDAAEGLFQGMAKVQLKQVLVPVKPDSSPQDIVVAVDRLQRNKDFPLVLCCQDGEASQRGYHRVVKAGYTNVFVVKGGWKALQAEA